MMKKIVVVTMIFLLGCIFSYTPTFAAPNVIDFEVEIELLDHIKYDIEYEVKGENKIEARYAVTGSVTLHGKNAVEVIVPLIEDLKLSPDMDAKTIKGNILNILQIQEKKIDDFELEIKFENGKKIKLIE